MSCSNRVCLFRAARFFRTTTRPKCCRRHNTERTTARVPHRGVNTPELYFIYIIIARFSCVQLPASYSTTFTVSDSFSPVRVGWCACTRKGEKRKHTARRTAAPHGHAGVHGYCRVVQSKQKTCSRIHTQFKYYSRVAASKERRKKGAGDDDDATM